MVARDNFTEFSRHKSFKLYFTRDVQPKREADQSRMSGAIPPFVTRDELHLISVVKIEH
jgi:hypothetical protein